MTLADEKEYTSVVKDFLNSIDTFTACRGKCYICEDCVEARKLLREVGAGQKLAPDFMKRVDHPLLKDALIKAICLRAANAKVRDEANSD
jgi:hypothetical protein